MLNNYHISFLPFLGTTEIEAFDQFSKEFGIISVVHITFSILPEQTLEQIKLRFAEFNLLRSAQGLLQAFHLNLSILLFIMFSENLLQMCFDIVHSRADSASAQLLHFVLNDMLVDFSVGYLFVSMGIGDNLRDISQFNHA